MADGGHAKRGSWVAAFTMILGTLMLAGSVAGEVIWLGFAGVGVGLVGVALGRVVRIMEDTR